MDNVRIAVLDAYDNVCIFLDNTIDEAMHYYKDELHTYLSGSAYTSSLLLVINFLLYIKTKVITAIL